MRWNTPRTSTGRPRSESGKRVAVVGAGPAGLTAAYFLRQAGHDVTVFDQMPEAGGMLTYSIPAYRLPKDVMRDQVHALEGMGIRFELGANLGGDGLTLGRSASTLSAACSWRPASGTGSRSGWRRASCSTPA